MLFSPLDWSELIPLLSIAAAAAVLLVGILLLVLIVTRVDGRAYRNAGRRVLVYLESAARLGAPLPEMVEAAAVTEGGRFGRRLWNLAEQLRAGRNLRDSLLICTPQVPARLCELIGAAERTGRLAEGLTDILERERRTEQLTVRAIEWIYPLVVMAILVAIVSLALVFVWPKFQEIYADFEVIENLGTARVMGMELDVLGPGGLAMFVLGTLAIGVLAAVASLALVIVLFHRLAGRPMPLLMSQFSDGLSLLVGRVPVIGRALRDRQLADVCYIVECSLRTHMPLESALMEAQSLRIDPWLRSRLMRWAGGLHAGAPADQAARAAGMPRLLAGMLATGQASARPAEAFEFLHRYYSARFSRALELLRGAVVPAAVLVVGAITGLTVLAMLSPLFALIDQQVLLRSQP